MHVYTIIITPFVLYDAMKFDSQLVNHLTLDSSLSIVHSENNVPFPLHNKPKKQFLVHRIPLPQSLLCIKRRNINTLYIYCIVEILSSSDHYATC